eukprot:3059524-Heterocapsa_arctica.AAC.1
MDLDAEKSGFRTLATLNAIARFLPLLVQSSGCRRPSSSTRVHSRPLSLCHTSGYCLYASRGSAQTAAPLSAMTLRNSNWS